MNKHTTGPWTRNEFGTILDAKGHTLCATGLALTTCRQNDEFKNEVEANSNLIAAAPDLLEALKEIVEYSGGATNALLDVYVMQRVNASIAKAEGRE